MDVIFIHGWSDRSRSMERVSKGLKQTGLEHDAYYFDYRSRDDEATLADFAEGLHHALKEWGLLQPASEVLPPSRRIRRTLRFVTHSTGALVVRKWMQQYDWARAAERVASICYLAPANFGSPLAHKGRSFLGRLSKGIREMRDFGESGRKTLEALELASPEQWELAEYDLFGSEGTVYGPSGVRAAVITGASGYGGLRSFVNEDGTDGTIVVSGAGLCCRKFEVDFASGRAFAGWIEEDTHQPDVAQLILAEPNHSTILDLDDDGDLAQQVIAVLRCTSANYPALVRRFEERSLVEETLETRQGGGREKCQQFVFRVRDDRGDAVPDYFIEFGACRRERILWDGAFPVEGGGRSNSVERRLSSNIRKHFGSNVHTHSVDSSLRRFLIEPAEVDRILGDEHVLTMKMVVQSGDSDIVYDTDRFANVLVHDPSEEVGSIRWTYPDTTTLVDLRVDRFTKGITSMRKDG